jgi:quercetin dioxygenase-like cupin family protein
MRKLIFAVVAVLVVTGAVKAEEGSESAAAPAHRMVPADDVAWGPAPPGLPAGSKLAVLEGDPTAAEPFTMRAWMPDGYFVPPHWHPIGEHLTVLSGTLVLGMGEKLDPAQETALGSGGFAAMPAGMRHWARAEGETVIQIHGVGPFDITYVDPADDPRTSPPAAE